MAEHLIAVPSVDYLDDVPVNTGIEERQLVQGCMQWPLVVYDYFSLADSSVCGQDSLLQHRAAFVRSATVSVSIYNMYR